MNKDYKLTRIRANQTRNFLFFNLQRFLTKILKFSPLFPWLAPGADKFTPKKGSKLFKPQSN